MMPSLETARNACHLMWLSDGRIFALGGYDGINWFDSVEMINRCWTRDAKTSTKGAWRHVAPMLHTRCLFAAVQIHGVILVCGGFTNGGRNLASAEIFHPPPPGISKEMGQWTSIKPMKSPMQCFGGVVFDDTVFVFGTLLLIYLPFYNI